MWYVTYGAISAVVGLAVFFLGLMLFKENAPDTGTTEGVLVGYALMGIGALAVLIPLYLLASTVIAYFR